MVASLTFFGGGNMATAVMGGLAGAAEGQRAIPVQVVDPVDSVRARWERDFHATAHAHPNAAACSSDCWVLAVKPQDMHTLCAQLHRHGPGHSALVLSVAAGVRISTLVRWLGQQHRIVRSMPNTPALIGMGISALYAPPEVGSADRDAAQALLGGVGDTLWLGAEGQIDAVTAVSGSGPAYVFRFMEALQDAAHALGLAPEQARQLVIATLCGAGALAQSSPLQPAQLREQVTSKGGTTAAALAVMEQEDFAGLMRRALQAAASRSVELSQLSDTATSNTATSDTATSNTATSSTSP